MTERRYSPDEVTAIFQEAATTDASGPRQRTPGEGMTLVELQDIGREVGLSPQAIARAARAVDRPVAEGERRFLGFPIGVRRTVDLGRRISDAEWEVFVADLRETFAATGQVRHDGPFRQWSNGNLKVTLEPTPIGHRVRFQALRAVSRELMTSGGVLGFFGLSMLVATLIAGGLGGARPLTGAVMLALGGLFMYTAGAMRLPGWARLRKQQMDDLAERLSGGVYLPLLEPPEP